ncbi:hypothetical protein AUJ69_00495 [Candidatus Woesearchaeota archaeon CG1_02_47_18]|nr:MAG: hypothetical protein AUJ69_00495 [Candidatus Woesearchaeota archaeon CG1_02_47_18]
MKKLATVLLIILSMMLVSLFATAEDITDTDTTADIGTATVSAGDEPEQKPCLDKCAEYDLNESLCARVCVPRLCSGRCLGMNVMAKPCREICAKIVEGVQAATADAPAANATPAAGEGAASSGVQRRVAVKRLAQLRNQEAFRRYNAQSAFKARVVAANRLSEAKQNYLDATKNYLKVRAQYADARSGLARLKNERASCSENCTAAEQRLVGRSRAILIHAADMIISHLEMIRSKVEASDALSDEEAESIISDLDERIAAVTEAKQTVEGFDNSTPKQDVIGAAQTIKREWVKTRIDSRLASGLIMNARLGRVILKATRVEERIERLLSRLEERGVDTSAIASDVEELKNHTAIAREEYELARDGYEAARLLRIGGSTGENVSSKIQEAHEHMKAAHKEIKAAYAKLKDIVKALKQSATPEEAAQLVSTEETEDDEAEGNATEAAAAPEAT